MDRPENNLQKRNTRVDNMNQWWYTQYSHKDGILEYKQEEYNARDNESH